MQKPNLKDIIRTGGFAVGTAGLLFAGGLSQKIPVAQLVTPMALGIMFAIGIAVSIFDLIYALKRPDRLAIARGEKMLAPTEVRESQVRAVHAINVVIVGKLVTAGIIVVGIVGAAVFWQ